MDRSRLTGDSLQVMVSGLPKPSDRMTIQSVEHHWLIVERIENWDADRQAGFSIFGLPPRYGNISSEIKKGDLVYCYVSSGISAFSDIRVVQDTGIKKLKEEFLL